MRIAKTGNKQAVEIAVAFLKKGKAIVCPTDTIYGLLADATNAKVVKKIFFIKKRSKKKPLGIFVRSIAEAKKFAKIGKKQERFLKRAWPGKVTVILKSKDRLAKELGASKTVGIRFSNHGIIRSLLRKLSRPLAQTSVNIAGKPPMAKVQDMVALFSQKKHRPDLIIDAGLLPYSKPSKVIDLTAEKIKILRA